MSVVVVTLVVLYVVPAVVMGAAPSPALKQLVAAADKEGVLTLSWSQTTLAGSHGAALFQAGMQKVFGTKVRINFVPGADFARVGNQLATEHAAGQKAHTDVFIAAAAQIVPILGKDLFEPVDVQAYLPDLRGQEVTELDNRFVRIVTGVTGATYNAKLAPMKPTRLEDFLRPEWKGKIASTPYAAALDVLAADDVWGRERTLDYARKLSAQISGLLRCGEGERIATGEYLALVMDCTGQDAIVWQEKGAPLEQMIPPDAAQKRYYYLAVPRHAQAPNAAKLFTAFMLTDEGQRLAYRTWKADLHLLKDSAMGRKIAGLEKQGVKFKEVTVSWWKAHPEIDAVKREIIKILTTKN
jgi:iron(III) transport system substrate-binding protein